MNEFQSDLPYLEEAPRRPVVISSATTQKQENRIRHDHAPRAVKKGKRKSEAKKQKRRREAKDRQGLARVEAYVPKSDSARIKALARSEGVGKGIWIARAVRKALQ